jgi:hypothetical protein
MGRPVGWLCAGISVEQNEHLLDRWIRWLAVEMDFGQVYIQWIGFEKLYVVRTDASDDNPLDLRSADVRIRWVPVEIGFEPNIYQIAVWITYGYSFE